MPIPQLPPELIEGILQNLWHDVLTAWQRIHFMKSCPLVNREWRALYDMIASRDVYIPSMQYLHYLLHIISTGQSYVHTPTSRFSMKTRSIIVPKVDLGDSNWWRPSERTLDQHAQMATYKRLLSELQYSSFSGVHLCFPAATHIIFEAITTRRTVDLKYTQLRVRLDGHTTVNALWRVNLGYHDIEPEQEWTSWSRNQLACSVISALDAHMVFFGLAGFPPNANDVRDSLTLESDMVLAFPVSWTPKPFPRYGSENLDLYFKRAAVGYYSYFILVDYLRHWWHNAKYWRHLPLSQFYARPNDFHVKQDVQPFYGLRILNVVLAVPVNLYMIFRWPWFSIAYTSLIFCFCSEHSFLVCVSILTLLTSFVMTRFLFLLGLVFSLLAFLVPIILMTRFTIFPVLVFSAYTFIVPLLTLSFLFLVMVVIFVFVLLSIVVL